MASDILAEGWLRKQSRHRGVFRLRWAVLTAREWLFFREARAYLEPPTEQVLLSEAVAVRLDPGAGTLAVATRARTVVIAAPADDASPGPSLLAWLERIDSARAAGALSAAAVSVLHDDAMLLVLGRLPRAGMAAASRVCRAWRRVGAAALQAEAAARWAEDAPLWACDARFHLGSLRRHRAREGGPACFTLHEDHTGKLLLRADPVPGARAFTISAPLPGPQPVDCLKGADPLAWPVRVLAVLEAGPGAGSFTLYDGGAPGPCAEQHSPWTSLSAAFAAQAGRPVRSEPRALARQPRAMVTVRHSPWAARAITAALAPGADGGPEAEQPFGAPPPPPYAEARAVALDGAPALIRYARQPPWAGPPPGLPVLRNTPPLWNADLGAFTLPFYGRVTMASKKNFQLRHPEDPDRIVLMFGKYRRDVYSLDYCRPLCKVAALAVALSAFDAGGKRRAP